MKGYGRQELFINNLIPKSLNCQFYLAVIHNIKNKNKTNTILEEFDPLNVNPDKLHCNKFFYAYVYTYRNNKC